MHWQSYTAPYNIEESEPLAIIRDLVVTHYRKNKRDSPTIMKLPDDNPLFPSTTTSTISTTTSQANYVATTTNLHFHLLTPPLPSFGRQGQISKYRRSLKRSQMKK